MVFFDDCEVLINGTGILAENASISSQIQTNQVYTLGRKTPIATSAVSNFNNSIDISYNLETDDPNFKIVNFYKEIDPQFSYNGVYISVGGVTGYCYPNNFSISVNENNIAKANVSYISFNNFSGSLKEKIRNPYLDIVVTGLPNTGDTVQVNGGTTATAVLVQAGPEDWLADTLENAQQSIWLNSQIGYGGELQGEWDAPNTSKYQIVNGVRFISNTPNTTPTFSIQGNWSKLSSGTTDFYPKNITKGSGLVHSWTTFVGSPSEPTYLFFPIYNLEYSANLNWQPIYKIGKLEPIQVNLSNIEETIIITKDTYNDFDSIRFTGMDSRIFLNLGGNDNNIDLLGLASLGPETGLHTMYVLSTGMKVLSNNINSSLDDMVRVTTVMKRFS